MWLKHVSILLLLLLPTFVWGDVEPNDSCLQAESISINQLSTLSGSLQPSGQNDSDDYYKFTANASGSLSLTLSVSKNTTGYLYGSALGVCIPIPSLASNTSSSSITLSTAVISGLSYFLHLHANVNGNNTYTTTNTTLPANHAPIITAPNGGNAYSPYVAENTTALTDIDATDADGNTLTYSLSGTDAAQFTINPNTGIITFASTPDYEAPTDSDANNIYSFTVTVSDGSLSDTQIFTVTVTDLNEPPTITSPNSASIPENTTAVATVAATDPDIGQAITYTLSGTDAAKFSISNTGIITFVTAPNFENPTDTGNDNVYNFTVTASDNGSPVLTVSQAFVVTVNDVIELVADYRLDECGWNGAAGEVKDSSLSALHGKAVNGANTNVGKICKSGQFDGTNDHVDLGNVLNPAGSSWSVSVWFKWDGKTGDNIIYNKENLYEARVSGGYFQYAWMPHWNWDGGTSFPVAQNTWYHAVVTYDGTTQKVYKNGVKVYERAQSGTIGTNTNKLLIGARGSGSPSSFFGGNIDEVQIFDMALTADKIATLYTNEASGKNYDGSGRTCTSCLIADYHLDECTWNGVSNEVLDSYTNGYHGTLKKKIMVLDNGKVCRSPALFNDDSYVELSTFPNLTSNMTITAWFKTTDIAASGQRVFADDKSNSGGYAISVGDGGSGKIRFYDRSQSGAGIIDSDAILQNNTWYFVAAVADITAVKRYLYLFDANGNLINQKSLAMTNTARGSDTGVATIAGEADGGETANRFKGAIDEVKVFNSALSQTQIQTIVEYEKQGLHYDGSIRTCNSCVVIPPNCTSLTYELYHPLSSAHKLQTRIAQQPFDLNVSVACTSGTDPIPKRQIKKIYAVTGTCPTVTTGLPILWNNSADINDTVKTITLSGLNSLKAYSNLKLMLETNASELNCSTDTFAIRPPSYTISSPSSPIKAADFTLQISANNSGSGYNGTAMLATGLQTANPNCSTSSGFITSSLGSPEPLSITFQNDSNSSTMKATDVGDVYINAKDTTWTTIDLPNECIANSHSTMADSQGLVGCNIENNLSVRIIPNHFDLNATFSNFAGGTFTYLSNSLEMNATLDLNMSAKNSEGMTTANYDEGCYAKTTSLTLAHSAVPDPLSKILYYENNTLLSGNAPKTGTLILPFTKSIFADGNGKIRLDVNFDRNSSKPLNPFDFTITSADVNDTDNVTGTGIPMGNTTFVYGRSRPYNITTNEASAPNPIEFEVYSSTSGGFVNGMPQNILKWYRNIHHDSAAAGNAIRGGFSAGTTESAINVSALPQDGTQIVTVTSTSDKTVHLDISPWLWYSSNPAKSYNYGTDCSQHPCFLYDYTGTGTGVKGVSSGTFQGSDFPMTPAKNITNKGVKVFR